MRVVLSVSVGHLRLSTHLKARLLVESFAKLGLYLVEGSNAKGLLQVQLGLSFSLNMLLHLCEGRKRLPLLLLVKVQEGFSRELFWPISSLAHESKLLRRWLLVHDHGSLSRAQRQTSEVHLSVAKFAGRARFFPLPIRCTYLVSRGAGRLILASKVWANHTSCIILVIIVNILGR